MIVKNIFCWMGIFFLAPCIDGSQIFCDDTPSALAHTNKQSGNQKECPNPNFSSISKFSLSSKENNPQKISYKKELEIPHLVCFMIDYIYLQSSTLAIEEKVQKEFKFLIPILQTFTHQCLDTQKISELLNKIKLKSFKKGYITTNFGLKSQDLNTKTLIVMIETSILKEIEYENKNRFSTLFWGKDYGIKIGDIFCIKPIDRGFYNFKRLKTQNPTMEILSIPPENQQDAIGSKLIIKPHSSLLPIYASFNANNGGSLSSGIYQTSFQLGLENILSLAEIFNTYVVLTPNWKNAHNIYASFDFSIPFRRFLFSINTSYSEYAQNIPILKNTFKYHGYSANMDIKGGFLIYMDNLNQITFNFGLGKKWAKNYLENIELIPQRRNLTNVYANFNYLRYIKQASFNLSLGIKQGVKFLGAMENLTNSQESPDFFYTIPTIDIYAYAPFDMNRQHFAYTGFLKTQVSRTRLYANEKFNLGGIYSVRGFDSSALNGEIGILNRNDLAYYFPPFFRISLVPTLGIDMGYTTDIYMNSQDRLRNQGFLIGGGGGLKIYWGRYFNTEIWGYAPFYNPSKLKGRYFYASAGIYWQ
ncbi:ShlB/FhaC/HecB family hemolysin secretion/activation protein [Helicobacter sp. 11S03491-1]|uniref:ShlB/FhaC/HecB family hemolysin secretion/activation protein n=1 Tax=Helicobacter sp. 11S03491-1 TaxID=1476196 RepID=UPI000BC8646E|nr:ShlB/FhaC/HecB family hemolysin secretion/activation protein [Helicobacter sp. 11S03491-1]PAF43087.1 hypothetical protein BKH45_03215 [Helicobacter sp. 11S03491-1]